MHAVRAKYREYVSYVCSYVMKVGSNIGLVATGSAGPAPTPLNIS